MFFFLEKLFLKEQKAVEGGGEGWCKSWLLHKAGDQRGWQPGKANQISLKLRKDFANFQKRFKGRSEKFGKYVLFANHQSDQENLCHKMSR